MAKKRKAQAASNGGERREEDFNKRVRLNLDSYEDVAASDDEFHLGRDKVLLDEPAAQKRARKLREKEQFLEPSDEEILGSSGGEEPADDYEEDDFDEAPQSDRRKGKMSLASDDDDDGKEDEEEEDELNEWGASRQDFYGADEMETEQDALDEEAEAKRLQQKQLQAMSAADYGFDEDEWAGRTSKDEGLPKKKTKTVTEVLQQLPITEDMGAAERLKLLKSRFPEFEPLSKEFLELREVLGSLQAARAESSRVSPAGTYSDHPASVATIKERTASGYLAILGMYFAVLSAHDPAEGGQPSATAVREHPVMDSLLSLRTLWQRVKDLPEEDDHVTDTEALASDDMTGVSEADVDQELLVKPAKKRSRKSAAEKAAAAAARANETKRQERMEQAEEELADLDALLTTTAPKKARSRPAVAANDDSDLGETALTEAQLAAKAAKRKSLRFYTSQIAQKAEKRGSAGRGAGGDDDIPHRERLRDRQQRLLEEAARRGKSKADDAGKGVALDGRESEDDEDRAAASQLRAEAYRGGKGAVDNDDDDDYYQTIASGTAAKRADKEARASARKEALLHGGRVVEEESVGADGKRAITYAIEKNKGLTPRRKKEVRNPRVKKRVKYEERKKKLGSMRAVYKGGEGRGGYGGEATGIKTGLVKSRKL